MRRIAFLDTLRVLAIFMVLVIHSTEPYYLGGDGTFVASAADAEWVALFEVLCRCCVPLFVMASAYLLFPVTKPTGAFLKRRFLRVFVPFALWCGVYTWWNGGTWSGGDWTPMLFNFPMAAGGHLWFVPMILGLYLAMPLLSPWAEKASEREIRGWLLVWAFTTLFPFLRRFSNVLCGDPSFGAVPYLYGECPWNAFGTFQYVSGFFGYMLLGFWFRKFAGEWSWRTTLSVSALTGALGAFLMGVPFYLALLARQYPLSESYAYAVCAEMSIEYCSIGVALSTFAYFTLIRKLNFESAFGRWIVTPLANASYGVYLVHIIVLVPVSAWLKPLLPTPLGIIAVASLTFVISSAAVLVLRRLPLVKNLVG